MGLIDTITGGRIYLDTNIVIYALEGYPEFAPALTSLFKAVDENKIKAVTSELTLAEALVKPLMVGNAVIENVYLDTLRTSASFQVVAISRQILIEAARLRARANVITLPDAIHLATAQVHACQYFLTNDKRMKSIADFDIIVLSEAGL
ncbi:MAG: VapC toxin family PIN domain ribonuclease [Syntrophus sp. (in: bacteria)]|nr:VapC toxin family PIN domain ribonuclease [Syntrophus sp. (in: bacteria)]